jgi:hypothetical protein
MIPRAAADHSRVSSVTSHGEEGGERSADSDVVDEVVANVGATSWAARCSAAATVRGTVVTGLVGDPTLEPVNLVASPAVTHVKYRAVR